MRMMCGGGVLYLAADKVVRELATHLQRTYRNAAPTSLSVLCGSVGLHPPQTEPVRLLPRHSPTAAGAFFGGGRPHFEWVSRTMAAAYSLRLSDALGT